MAKYDNIDINGNKVEPSNTPTYDSIMKQKAKDTKKALPKQKKADDAEKVDKAMQESVDKEYEAQKELEKTALENNGSSIENRDYNKTVQETGEEPKVEETEVEETKVEEPKVEEPKVEEPKEPTNLTEVLTAQGVPENATTDLVESDEGKEVDEVITSGDPAGLENVVTPDGESVLKGSYDERGNYVPYTYTEADTRLVKNKGLAAVLTIISGALSVLGAAAGIPIVPINFFRFGASPQEDLERMNQVEKDYAKLRNAGSAEAQEIEKTEGAKTAAYESNAKAAIENPELYDSDVQNKVAGSAAALAGGNTQLQTQESAQEFQVAQNDFDRQFQKEMAQINNDSAMALLKQQGMNAQDLLKLQADENAMADLKKITAMKNAGLSDQEAAQWIRSLGGMTALQAYLGPIINGAGQAAGILTGLFAGGTSDKNAKKFAYDGKAANSKMFSSKRKFW